MNSSFNFYLEILLQGNAAGQLQSTYNPAWDGVNRLNCTLPVPVIISAPASLSNRTSGSSTFSTVDGARLNSNELTCHQ